MKFITGQLILLTLAACGIQSILPGNPAQAQESERLAERSISASSRPQMTGVIFSQNFDWDDDLDSGQYVWGQDEFLKMDGSKGKIVCRHQLKSRITDGNSRLKISAVFVRGRPYRIDLNNEKGEPVVTATIERDGRIVFGANTLEEKESGTSLGCAPGMSCKPAANEHGPVQASPLHVFEMSDFSYLSGTVKLTFDKKVFSGMSLARNRGDIYEIEIQTLAVEPGSIVWLKEFRQENNHDKLVEDEQFQAEWTRNVGILPGYPADKWQVTSYRPRSFKWLEMKTQYGAVYVRFSPIPVRHGSVDLDIMSDHMEHEAQVNLGQFKYEPMGNYGYLPADSSGISTISGGWNVDAGAFDGAWTPFLDVIPNEHPTMLHRGGSFMPFDSPPPAVADRPYRLRIEWDIAAKSYHVWIDGIAQKYHGSPDLQIISRS